MQHEGRARDRRRTMEIVAMTCLLSLGLSGCRHKLVVPPLPAITQPVELVTPPPPNQPQMVEVPQIAMPAVPVAANGGRPRRERRKTAKPSAATPAPTEVASAEPAAPSPEETAIGALSTGGDSNPRVLQEVADLIASIDKRLNALSSQKAEEEKSQISKIRNFQRQAQEALTSGDAEGAKTLATKAKLLLDDLTK